MADTTPDLSHKFILSVVVRFVNDKGKPEERLLEVREIVDKTGKGMANEILETLSTNNLDLQNLVFQSYDFANYMSGQFNGAQQKISEAIGRKIPYIPSVLNITDATLFISSTLKSLDIINCDSENMNNLIQSAVVFLKKYVVDAEKEFSVRHHRRIAPKNLDINRSNAFEFSFYSFYRKEFKVVLDKLNGLIKDHLEKSINDIKPLYSMFKPAFSKKLLTETLIQDAIQLLPNNIEIDTSTLQCELEVLYDQCQNKSTMSDLAIVSHELKTALPLANLLCHLSCTVPVTVAGNERSFSKLKIVKNYLRTTQEDSRLNNLILISSEKDLVDKISLNEMAQKWYIQFAITVSL
ncbi:uncharacterized protein LOC112592715 [Melanaphis sacchari]|uniref:uncharacterized protein LOC112592715 n=1 Tax=Melanaphis sacchari TaxID=742174 RepID=UPI000DC13B86|nr:uncharacterized protein LOC112592715 [Melanaphis sacchari]